MVFWNKTQGVTEHWTRLTDSLDLCLYQLCSNDWYRLAFRIFAAFQIRKSPIRQLGIDLDQFCCCHPIFGGIQSWHGLIMFHMWPYYPVKYILTNMIWYFYNPDLFDAPVQGSQKKKSNGTRSRAARGVWLRPKGALMFRSATFQQNRELIKTRNWPFWYMNSWVVNIHWLVDGVLVLYAALGFMGLVFISLWPRPFWPPRNRSLICSGPAKTREVTPERDVIFVDSILIIAYSCLGFIWLWEAGFVICRLLKRDGLKSTEACGFLVLEASRQNLVLDIPTTPLRDQKGFVLDVVLVIRNGRAIWGKYANFLRMSNLLTDRFVIEPELGAAGGANGPTKRQTTNRMWKRRW